MSDSITIVGNIATDPHFRRSQNGVTITSFRLASTQRVQDRATGAWSDGDTNWYSVSTYRALADHSFASLRKGERVIVTGRLRIRDWEAGDKHGTSVDIDADAVGHDLLWGTTLFTRDAPPTGAAPASPTDAWATPAVPGAPDAGGAAGWAVPGAEPMPAASTGGAPAEPPTPEPEREAARDPEPETVPF
ncbi:single-stranded DNA-binding protein [Microbacterium fluvii]|uniref:Single-stranded DNA-binding protein n=1 Tax=Microbacterium fluvii TaxID=415215 RepID=A0ABW2HCM4_9MICO|nr:single-stranded DNA-binding protein [Microbacterium fluvii]MCU4672523.1 single-stranded DNA-binding protein [Microbacterium fluvii]